MGRFCQDLTGGSISTLIATVPRRGTLSCFSILTIGLPLLLGNIAMWPPQPHVETLSLLTLSYKVLRVATHSIDLDNPVVWSHFQLGILRVPSLDQTLLNGHNLEGHVIGFVRNDAKSVAIPDLHTDCVVIPGASLHPPHPGRTLALTRAGPDSKILHYEVIYKTSL